MRDPRHRDDLDGLRAVAIAAVVLYHLGFSRADGGFLGVDVFFVLSGYFITAIVWRRLNDGNLSLPGFYFSRLSRIAPAMLCVIALAYVCGAIVLPPYLFKELSASALFSSLGLANIWFWMQSGYFDLASSSKPLLHLWSLAVELQFYAVAPLLLIVLHRFRSVVNPAMVVGASSVVLAVAGVVALHLNATAAFYATPLRLWEFGAGCTVALMPRVGLGRITRTVIALLAFALVIASIVFLDKPWRLGGVGMFVPVLASALVIGYCSGTFVGRVLGFAAPLGRLAYSIYLTHWPIIVYARLVLHRTDFTLPEQVAIGAASVLTALALHWFIELPFWKGGGVGRFRIRAVSLAALVLLATTSAGLSWAGGGWAWRFPPSAIAKFVDIDASHQYVWANQHRWAGFDFGTQRPNVLVIGDSQSADLMNLLIEGGLDREVDLAAYTVFSECAVPYLPKPDRDYFLNTLDFMTSERPDIPPVCERAWDELLADPRLAQADRVIISIFWRDFALPYLQQAVDTIGAHTKGTIVLVGNKGMGKSGIELLEHAQSLEEAEQAAVAALDPVAANVNRLVSELSGVTFFDMTQLFCPGLTACAVATEDGYPILFDGNHMTKPGAQYLAARRHPELLSLIGAPSGAAP